MFEKVMNELKNAMKDESSEKYLEMLGSYWEQINVNSDVPEEEKNENIFWVNNNLSKRKTSKRSINLTEEAIKRLKNNENVECITHGDVYYTMKFKQKAVTEYLSGKDPVQIFKDAGFCPEELSARDDYVSSTIQRWRKELIGSKPQAPLHSYKGLIQRNRFLELENKLLRKIVVSLEK